MSNILHIVDFDRTSFQTDRFSEDLLRGLEEREHLSAQQADDLLGALEIPDTADIIALLTQDGIPLTEIIGIIDTLKADYLYPDARRYIEETQDVFVLTTAVSVALQEAKIRQSGLLVPHHIVMGNKGLFLKSVLLQTESGARVGQFFEGQNEYSGIQLVDDKFSSLEPLLLEEGVEVILMTRPDSKYPPTAEEVARVRVISSFEELEA